MLYDTVALFYFTVAILLSCALNAKNTLIIAAKLALT